MKNLFKVVTLLPNIFGPYIRNLGMFFFQFWSTLILAMCGINISGPSSPIKQPFFQTNKPTKKITNELTFQCKLYSIPLKLRCDGTPHCMPDGEDEKDCLKGNIF